MKWSDGLNQRFCLFNDDDNNSTALISIFFCKRKIIFYTTILVCRIFSFHLYNRLLFRIICNIDIDDSSVIKISKEFVHSKLIVGKRDWERETTFHTIFFLFKSSRLPISYSCQIDLKKMPLFFR